MPKLGQLLNVFFKARLVLREKDKSPSDPTMKVYINKDFKYETPNVSFVNVTNIAQQQQQSQNVDKEISDKFAIGRENILQAAIVRCMKQNKHLTNQELLEKVKVVVPFTVNNDAYVQMVTKCINEKYIKQTDTTSIDYLEDEDSDEEENV